MMRGWLYNIFLATICCKPAVAEPFEWAFQLNSGGSEYRQSNVWSGHFIAANGIKFDVSNLYKSTKPQLNISGQFVFYLPKRNTNFVLPINYDNGYASPLYSAQRRLDIGLWVIHSPYEKLALRLGIANLLTFGGTIREKPCVDQFVRGFHCGTGLPWIDYQPSAHRKLSRKTATIQLTYSF